MTCGQPIPRRKILQLDHPNFLLEVILSPHPLLALHLPKSRGDFPRFQRYQLLVGSDGLSSSSGRRLCVTSAAADRLSASTDLQRPDNGRWLPITPRVLSAAADRLSAAAGRLPASSIPGCLTSSASTRRKLTTIPSTSTAPGDSSTVVEINNRKYLHWPENCMLCSPFPLSEMLWKSVRLRRRTRR